MLPSLLLIQRNNRHFELFVGSFLFVTKFLYNTSEAIQLSLYLDEGDWHLMSDILMLSYISLLVIHLISRNNENEDQFLRYLFFSISWIVKIKDQWNTLNQSIFLTLQTILVIYKLNTTRVQLNPKNLEKLVIFFITTILLFIMLQTIQFDSSNRSGRIFHTSVEGLLNLSTGGLMYFGWKTMPMSYYKSIV